MRVTRFGGCNREEQHRHEQRYCRGGQHAAQALRIAIGKCGQQERRLPQQARIDVAHGDREIGPRLEPLGDGQPVEAERAVCREQHVVGIGNAPRGDVGREPRNGQRHGNAQGRTLERQRGVAAVIGGAIHRAGEKQGDDGGAAGDFAPRRVVERRQHRHKHNQHGRNRDDDPRRADSAGPKCGDRGLDGSDRQRLGDGRNSSVHGLELPNDERLAMPEDA